MLSNQPPVSSLELTPNLTSQDQEHLGLLTLFGYILGGLTIVTSTVAFFLLLHLLISFTSQRVETALLCAYIFLIDIFGGLIVYTAHCIAERKNKTYIQVIAGLSCLSMSFGTIWGVFVFVILNRPTVAAAFNNQSHNQ